MSFLEFWGESVDPGKVGKVEIGQEHDACRFWPLVVARLLFVVIALPLAWWFGAECVPLPRLQALGLVIGCTLIYVGVAYLVRAEPNADNLGWGMGLMDNPFRYSDDLNRGLIWIEFVLGPGRFVAESVLDAIALCREPEEIPINCDGDDS